jgi:hypothetical protein
MEMLYPKVSRNKKKQLTERSKIAFLTAVVQMPLPGCP